MVSRLLSLGATQQLPPSSTMLPLSIAASKGFEGVVRVLLREGLEAVGGRIMLRYAMHTAMRDHRARVVRLLLSANGEEGRLALANTRLFDGDVLHYGAGFCCPASVNVLLAAGASEAARDTQGRTPREVIGANLLQEDLPMNRQKEVAVRRMLEQGPAYRARSWALPAKSMVGGGDCRVGGGGKEAVLSSAPATKGLPVGVRIFRPKSDRKLFVGLVGRYCEKD
ncbi:unnamed protein product [Laminaria digitata]